uniref:Uncharacterized protein n=1 Tax=Romanomermis culicivorax TaxID=13658 RepID=A0A915HJV8_ROMCU
MSENVLGSTCSQYSGHQQKLGSVSGLEPEALRQQSSVSNQLGQPSNGKGALKLQQLKVDMVAGTIFYIPPPSSLTDRQGPAMLRQPVPATRGFSKS